jgi:citrate synthase
MEHVPGFDPNGVSCPEPVRQTLAYLTEISDGNSLAWLMQHREQLEAFADAPLAMSGVAAAAMNDLSLSAEESEMLFMLLRLPGAAVHALEQGKLGWRRYPFFGNGLKLMPYDQVSDED